MARLGRAQPFKPLVDKIVIGAAPSNTAGFFRQNPMNGLGVCGNFFANMLGFFVGFVGAALMFFSNRNQG
jgi:hypothetical protein